MVRASVHQDGTKESVYHGMAYTKKKMGFRDIRGVFVLQGYQESCSSGKETRYLVCTNGICYERREVVQDF